MMQSSALMVRRPHRVAAVEPSPFGLVVSRIGSVSRGPRSEACPPLPSAPASAWAITDVQMRFGVPTTDLYEVHITQVLPGAPAPAPSPSMSATAAAAVPPASPPTSSSGALSGALGRVRTGRSTRAAPNR